MPFEIAGGIMTTVKFKTLISSFIMFFGAILIGVLATYQIGGYIVYGAAFVAAGDQTEVGLDSQKIWA